MAGAVVNPMLGQCLDSASPPITLFDGFKHTVKMHGKANALASKPNHTAEFSFVSWEGYYENCLSFAKALLKLDFKPHSSVNILGFNSPEWFYSLLGCVAAGGIAAGIYTTNLADACAYITEHSDCEVVCLDDDSQLQKIVDTIDKSPTLKMIVQWLPTKTGRKSGDKIGHATYMTYADFIAAGADIPLASVEERIAAQKPGQCASLIYTSGTTGPPKAVMISHDNAVWTSHAAENVMGGGSVDDRLISYVQARQKRMCALARDKSVCKRSERLRRFSSDPPSERVHETSSRRPSPCSLPCTYYRPKCPPSLPPLFTRVLL